MPINNITQTISILPPAGRRGVDVQTQFVIKQEDFQDHLQGTTVTELNTLKDQLNTTVTGMNIAVETINTKASEASTSATSASSSATTATTKASEASTSASNALSSENKAGKWADNNYNVEVEAGKYSAKHWASKAAEIVSAGLIDDVTPSTSTVFSSTRSNNTYEPKNSNIQGHISNNTTNPHNVTKNQVGLSNVDNTSDVNKPISTATSTALNSKQNTLISGTNIKTINNNSILGSGNVDIGGPPAGTIITFASATAPTGYLKANGALLSRTTYSALFAAMGTTFGAGDGSTTFALPDLRGYFPRGWDDSRGIDVGRVFGSTQQDDFKSHNHNVGIGTGSYAGGYVANIAQFSIADEPFSSGNSGGTETRPKNIALLYCIKY